MEVLFDVFVNIKDVFDVFFFVGFWYSIEYCSVIFVYCNDEGFVL